MLTRQGIRIKADVPVRQIQGAAPPIAKAAVQLISSTIKGMRLAFALNQLRLQTLRRGVREQGRRGLSTGPV